MADTCFLCEMGAKHVIKGAPSAGEGFGTCYDCSVHACPRHGDRTPKYFRCADCIAASGAWWALTKPGDRDAAEVVGEAPRLSVLSAELRNEFDLEQMGAAIEWVHSRAREGESLLPGAEQGIDFSVEENAARALGFSEEEVDWEAAADAFRRRAALVEEQVRTLSVQAAVSGEFFGEEQRISAGELAAASLAIAYAARGAERAEVNPLELPGGLLLPAPLVILGHAYSAATPVVTRGPAPVG